jgi:hypothetical protein
MQMTLSLNRRTHLFIRDGRLFFKLYKLNKFSDKKDYPIRISGIDFTLQHFEHRV